MSDELQPARAEVFRLRYTASMNRCYHQKMAARKDFRDRWTKFTLLGLAVIALVQTCLPEGSVLLWFHAEQVVAAGAVGLALWLSISPTDQRARLHLECFHRWNALMREADAILRGFRFAPELAAEWQERLVSANQRRFEIERDEPSDLDQKLLDKCQDEEDAKHRTDDAQEAPRPQVASVAAGV